jgi:hypothetical protein
LSEKRQKNYRKIVKDPEASVESIIKKALKTYKIKFKKRIVCINFVLFGALFCGSVALAQVNEQKQDTTKLVIL